MVPFSAPPLEPLHWIFLFTGLLWLIGFGLGRPAARWSAFPYLSAAFFLTLYCAYAVGSVFVHLSLLCLAALAFRLLRGRPLSGLVVVFVALFAYDLVSNLEAPRGYSYLLFRLFDGLSAPVLRHGRLLLQVFAFPTLLAGPILLRGEPRIPFRVPLTRGALLVSLGVLKIHVLLPLVEANWQTGLLTPLRFSFDGLKNFWGAGAYGYLRLFLDFSGYTDIVVGLLALLGLRVRHNFFRPYLACSVSDFWRRWHLTLGLWVRRHVYLPFGGSRGSGMRVARNLMLAMLLIGLWHGPHWHFLAWGALHGLALVLERATGLARKGAGFSLPRWFLTQNYIIVTWTIFFWK